MSPSLLHIARAGLYLSLFYAFYLLVMRRTTFFRLNRVLLLLGSYLCLLLPLVRLRTVTVALLSEAPPWWVSRARQRLPMPLSPGRRFCWACTWPEWLERWRCMGFRPGRWAD